MKRMTLVVILTAVVVVFLFSLLPVCSFASGVVKPLEIAERPTWQVGDTWVYELTLTDGSLVKKLPMKMTVIRSDEKGYTVAVDTDGEKTVEFYNRDINFVQAENEKGGMVEVCKPEVPIFQWPLKPGKWWKGLYYFQDNLRTNSFAITLTTEVIGSEFLVGTDGKEIATMKMVSKRENQKKRFLGQRETWYDPLVRFDIKRVQERALGKKEERNLISFTPGGTK